MKQITQRELNDLQKIGEPLHLDGHDLRGLQFSHRRSLHDSTFTDSSLECALFIGCDLRYTDFSHAKLSSVIFYESDLTEANLAGALCYCTLFRKANLTKANLQRAVLVNASFLQANLDEADLSFATIDKTDFEHASLADITDVGTIFERVSVWDWAIANKVRMRSIGKRTLCLGYVKSKQLSSLGDWYIAYRTGYTYQSKWFSRSHNAPKPKLDNYQPGLYVFGRQCENADMMVAFWLDEAIPVNQHTCRVPRFRTIKSVWEFYMMGGDLFSRRETIWVT